jgi:hypothetical protein
VCVCMCVCVLGVCWECVGSVLGVCGECVYVCVCVCVLEKREGVRYINTHIIYTYTNTHIDS